MWMDHFSVLICYHYFYSASEDMNASGRKVYFTNKEIGDEKQF